MPSSQGTGIARARSRARSQGSWWERAMTSELGDRSVDPARPETPAQPPANVPESAAPDPEITAYSSSSGDELNLLLGGSAIELKPDPFLAPISSGDPDAGPVASAQGPPQSESFDV